MKIRGKAFKIAFNLTVKLSSKCIRTFQKLSKKILRSKVFVKFIILKQIRKLRFNGFKNDP